MLVLLLFLLGALMGLVPPASTQLARFNYVATGIFGAMLGGLLPSLIGNSAASMGLRFLSGAAIAAVCVIVLARLRRLANQAPDQSIDQN